MIHNILLDRHLHYNLPMRGIILDNEIFGLEITYIFDISSNFQSRERSWLSFQLNLERINMVFVYMRISHGVDQLAGIDIADMCDHPCQ